MMTSMDDSRPSSPAPRPASSRSRKPPTPLPKRVSHALPQRDGPIKRRSHGRNVDLEARWSSAGHELLCVDVPSEAARATLLEPVAVTMRQ